jgi:hypothetical protein
MTKVSHVFRSRILSTFLFLALSCSAVFSQDARSPVGTWELVIARAGLSAKETGTVFLTFNADNTFTGYGLTTGSFTVFTLTGTWNVDSRGKLTGDYTQDLVGNLLEASFVGKATAGKRLEMNAVGILGKFKLKGIPLRSLPDISGAWNGTVIQIGALGKSFETYEFTNSSQFPGVLGISGAGAEGNLPFTISGAAIVTAKGKITAFKLNDFGGDQLLSGTFTGKFAQKKQTISLLGSDAAGLDVISVRVHLSRP